MEQFFSMVKTIPSEAHTYNHMRPLQPSFDNKEKGNEFIAEVEARRQYRQGYVTGWKMCLCDVNLGFYSRKIRGETLQSASIFGQTTFGGSTHVILTPNHKYYSEGFTSGRSALKQLDDEARRQVELAYPRWRADARARSLAGLVLEDNEIESRIRSIPELEALLYLHKHVIAGDIGRETN